MRSELRSFLDGLGPDQQDLVTRVNNSFLALEVKRATERQLFYMWEELSFRQRYFEYNQRLDLCPAAEAAD